MGQWLSKNLDFLPTLSFAMGYHYPKNRSKVIQIHVSFTKFTLGEIKVMNYKNLGNLLKGTLMQI